MYLAVDIGGTKTLLGVFDASGVLKAKRKFPTPKSYEEWLTSFRQNLQLLQTSEFASGAVAIPGEVDRKQGIGVRYGNLSWQNNPIKQDVENTAGCPVIIENDAKAAGLYEAKNTGNHVNKILYITIGTGVGTAYIVDGKNDLKIPDLGGAIITVRYGDKVQAFDSFASGKAIKEKYGQKAGEITDEQIWKSIVKAFGAVVLRLLKDYPADVVIFGGGVGAHFDRFGKLLDNELRTQLKETSPVLIPAKHTEEAVLFGCYELIKSRGVGAP